LEIAQPRPHPKNWVESIAHGYAKQLKAQMGVGWFRVQVRDRPGGPVAYELLMATSYSREANWVFNESVSKAHEEWHNFIASQPGQQTFKLDEDHWVATIKANIVGLLKKGAVPMVSAWPEAFEGVIGLAREMHARKAIKQLYAEGATLCDGKGQVNKLVITRGPNAPPLASS
jgi:hypothetical protein